MEMRRSLLTALLAVLIAGGCLERGANEERGLAEVAFQTDEGSISILCEVADDPGEREQGLMGRMSMPMDRGMLFVFDPPQQASFWMKDTYIPLDLVFVGANLSVIEVFECDPGAGLPDGELRMYTSPGPTAYAIELNKGFCSEHDVAKGASVEIMLPSADL